jgi:eukaryotic-like serine/threonine-protein kinase
MHRGGISSASTASGVRRLSPEQIQSRKDIDEQTDVWALGTLLFELLTGRVPFDGEAMKEVAVKIVAEPAPGLRALRPEAPEGLDAVIQRCLEKDQRKRYPDVAEVVLALQPFAPEPSGVSVERIT